MTWVTTEIFSVSIEAFWVLCRYRELCRDREWSRPGGLVSQHNKCFAIGWHDGGVQSQQRILGSRVSMSRHSSCVATGHSQGRRRQSDIDV